MSIKENFHTHTTYCDGKESPEQMIQAALAKDFTALGFSGHSYTFFDDGYCMSKEGTKQYVAELKELKEKYKDRIKVFIGVEQDFYATEPTEGLDYSICSVHYVKKNDIYYPVDDSKEDFLNAIQEGFGGDFLAYAKAFFETVGRIAERKDIDFVGHFDLLTKFNEGNAIFDMQNKKYLDYGIEAIDAICKAGIPFEINTGAMYRGLRTEPYPSIPFLQEIKKRNGQILLSSDSHDGASLGHAFAEMTEILKQIGFSSALVWREGGFAEREL